MDEWLMSGNWVPVRRIGDGGQAVVYLAVKYDVDVSQWDCQRVLEFSAELRRSTGTPGKSVTEYRENIVKLHQHSIAAAAKLLNAFEYGAMKKLKPDGEWTKETSRERILARMKDEIETLRTTKHPNLIRLLDADVSGNWFVMQYHRLGSLNNHLGLFRNQPLPALQAIRGLVLGVIELHQSQTLHRDIKTQNVFLAEDQRLILGDMGLVLRSDGDRHTQAGMNVGTALAMPPSLVNVELDQFEPAFDVYCLAKVLWSMVSGIVDTELPVTFTPDRTAFEGSCASGMEHVEDLLRKSLVYDHHDGLPDAHALLGEVDSAIERIQSPAEPIGLRIAAHAATRPGPPYLFSVDGVQERGQCPTAAEVGDWEICHPRAREIAEVTGDGTGVRPNERVWAEFQAPCGGHYVLSTRRDSTDHATRVDCVFKRGIHLADARFLFFNILIDNSIGARAYLFLGPDPRHFLCYSYDLKEPSIHPNASREFRIPAPEFRGSGQMQTIVRDIRDDLKRTWGTDGKDFEVISGIRLRGKFELRCARII